MIIQAYPIPVHRSQKTVHEEESNQLRCKILVAREENILRNLVRHAETDNAG